MTGRSALGQVVDLPAEVAYELIGRTVVAWRFKSSVDDYANIRERVGLLDLSGAGVIQLVGHDAEDLLQDTFTRDIAYMTPERTVIGLILSQDGKPLDVVTVYRLDDGFMVQTSMGQGARVSNALAHRRGTAGYEVEIADASDRLVLMAIEGPRTMDVIANLTEESVDGLPFQAVRSIEWGGVGVTVSRTGFTSEFGFTFIAPWTIAADLWRSLLTVAQPSGWEAIETAMVEVRQPVLYRELFEDDTVISAGLNWLVDLDKEFVGRDAILAEFEEGVSTARLSVVSGTRLERGARLAFGGRVVGEISYGVFSPGLDAYCGVARVVREALASGIEFELLDGSHRGTAGVVRSVSSPAVVPTSWRSLQR